MYLVTGEAGFIGCGPVAALCDREAGGGGGRPAGAPQPCITRSGTLR